MVSSSRRIYEKIEKYTSLPWLAGWNKTPTDATLLGIVFSICNTSGRSLIVKRYSIDSFRSSYSRWSSSSFHGDVSSNPYISLLDMTIKTSDSRQESSKIAIGEGEIGRALGEN